MFYKAFSAWEIGKKKESEDIFVDLFNNYTLNDDFKNYVYNNIINSNLNLIHFSQLYRQVYSYFELSYTRFASRVLYAISKNGLASIY